MMLSALLWNLLLTLALAMVLAAVCRLPWLRRRPAMRHTLWLLLLAKMVTPPLIAVPLLPAIDRVVETTAASRSVEAPLNYDSPIRHLAPPKDSPTLSTDSPIPSTDSAPPERRETPLASDLFSFAPSWPTFVRVLLASSFFGTIVLLAMHGFRGAKLGAWLKRRRAENTLLAECCVEVASSLKIRGTVRSCVVDARTAPMLWGCWRPIVVMPRQLMDDLNPDQLKSIVAHELAHFLRRDPLSNLFAFLVKALMWWNPIAWWAHRELRAAQELCCDAIAIEVCSRSCYAATLLKAVDFVQPESFAHRELALGMGARRSILRRFEMIADTKLSHRLSPSSMLILVMLTIPLLCMPVRGQDKKRAAASVTPSNEVLVGEQPAAITLVGIVSQDGRRAVWMYDQAKADRKQLQKGSAFRVGRIAATVEKIQKDAVTLKIENKLHIWKLGTSLAAMLKEKDRVKNLTPTKHLKKPSAQLTGKPVAPAASKESTAGDDQRLKVQLELIGDQILIHGKSEDVKRVTELLQRLEQGKLRAPGDADAKETENDRRAAYLESHSIGKLDPQTVQAVLKTMLAGASGVRLAIDPKTSHLIVLGKRGDHALVRSALEKMQPKVDDDAGKRTELDAVVGKGGKLRFAFDKKPWADVLEWYAKEAGLSLNMQDPIPGALTFFDDHPYTATEALDLLNRFLITKDHVLLRNDRLLYVVNMEKGVPQELAPRVEVGKLDQHGRFEFISVMFSCGRRDVEKTLAEIKPLLSKGGRAVALPESHKLLVTERAGIIRSIRDVIESIDEPTAKK